MRKALTALTAAATITVAAVATPTTADARRGWWGPAVVGGFAAAAIATTPSPLITTAGAGGTAIAIACVERIGTLSGGLRSLTPAPFGRRLFCALQRVFAVNGPVSCGSRKVFLTKIPTN